jgi:hypothetical protein
MKWLLAVTLACAAIVLGAPVHAQSKYDVCTAYARDTMTAFYSSSAVPVPRRYRGKMAPREPKPENTFFSTTADRARATKQTRGSLEFYMGQCMAR